MATLYIDGKIYEINETGNLLEACLSIGLNIPYFCWHPALGSIGSCRQCIVKQYQNIEDIQGRLIVSCMTPVAQNNFISIIDNEVQQFRKSIIELLMINHPHDCPICEEGGSCHLQDMTVMTGHNMRRYRFTKRTHYNQYLGSFISHEMNRCITCYRCINFYKNYAGGTDFGVYGIHDNIYFGRIQDGSLESEFSGNLIEICPTGVFTDKTHSKRYNRKWDMQFAPSICQQCSIGCNISPGERYGELRKIENRYNSNINGYFLCDRGRFGYGYINLKDRPRKPLKRYEKKWITLSIEQAINLAADIIRFSNKVIGIGSPRASIESNFALLKLVGEANFYTGISKNEQEQISLILNILLSGSIYTPSISEIESYDAILILGEDVTQTGARLALAIRQAIKGKSIDIAAEQKIAKWQTDAVANIGQNAKYPLFITNIDRTRLDDIAEWSYYASVNEQARLGFAIAHKLDKTAPAVTDLNLSLKDKIDLISKALNSAYKPLIISGSSTGNSAIIAAATNIAYALKKLGKNVGISFITNEVNSIGLAMIGKNSLDTALDELEKDKIDSVIVLENDLYRHAMPTRIDAAFTHISNLIVIDHQKTDIQKKANLILSTASFAESSGTLINQEARAQRFFQVYNPKYYDNDIFILESWRWLHSIHTNSTNDRISWTNLDHVINAIIYAMPQFAKIKYISPSADYRIHGQKLARIPHRYSGHTAMNANISVHEQQIPQDQDTMFTFSIDGNNSYILPRQHIAFAWAPGWNSSQAWNKFQGKIGGHLHNGNSGIRLLKINNKPMYYFTNIPSVNQSKYWYIAPYWHLFGSEETSQRSPIIQEQMPKPYVMINQFDAIRLKINVHSLLTFNCAGLKLCLPVRFSKNLSKGQLGLPMGLPGIPPILAGLKVENLKVSVL